MDEMKNTSTEAERVQLHWSQTQEYSGDGYETNEERVLDRRKYLAKLIEKI